MINQSQLRNLIIAPTLDELGHMSKDAEELIFAIACHESTRGTYLKQITGDALGIYQIEPKTYYDLFDSYLSYKKDLLAKVLRMIDATREPNANRLIWDLKLSTIMCRIFFLRIPEPLPPHNDINQIAQYWKKHYNTSLGKGDVSDFVNNYNLLK